MKGLIFMKWIYILNVRVTGSNGGIIHCTDSAYTDSEIAKEACNEMHDCYKDDPNFMAYITGPILLYEED